MKKITVCAPIYGVFIHRKDGSEFIATGANSGPAFFYQRKPAVVFKKELAAHKMKCRVVAGTVVFEERL